MNGIFQWATVIVILVFLHCLTHDKALKPQPRDSDMNILGYFEDIKNTANGLLWRGSDQILQNL